jgi:hypothetical protein
VGERSETGAYDVQEWRDIVYIIYIYLRKKIYKSPLSRSEGFVFLSSDPPPSSSVPTLVAYSVGICIKVMVYLSVVEQWSGHLANRLRA